MNAIACPYFSPGSTAEWITVAEIHIDAAQGCVYCKLLREIAIRLGEQHNLTFDVRHVRDYGWRRVSYKRGQNHIPNDIEVFAAEGSAKLFPELQYRVFDGRESLQKSLPYIQAWEHRCSEGHESCPKQLITVLPKRLIDVRTEPVQLIETTEDHMGRYIALSHCWGGSEPDCLTKLETLERNQCGITDQSLPHTFLDAIQVTKMLNIPYLWIDSLCIIQNDQKDWQRESAKMASYYQNSYLTICATAARSDDDGLWPREDSLSGVGSVVVQHGDTQFKIYVRTGQRQDDVDAAHMSWYTSKRVWSIAQEICPLVSRSWTLQERLLAPRLLHYGHQEILWQCPSSAACECCFSAVDGSKYMGYARRLTNTAWEMQGAETLTQVAQVWRMLVDFYSRLDLTKLKDRLPAISGLAKSCLSVRAPDVYRAGLWESTMIEDLCWHVPFGISRRARPGSWLAPTWSWASLSQHVSYTFWMTENGPLHTQFIEATTVLAGEDPTGEITSGSITLLGPIQTASVERVFRTEFTVRAHSLSLACYGDATTDFGKDGIQCGSTVWCLRMKSSSGSDWIMILVANDDALGTYRRVGMADHKTDAIAQHWYRDGSKTQIEIL